MKETIGFDLTEVMKANTYDAKVNKTISVDVKGLPESKS
jgi:flotillin